MQLAIWLLVLAVVGAAAAALGGRKGFIALAVLLVGAAIVIGSQSAEHAMFVGYVAAFALPAIVIVALLGAWSGSLLRGKRYALALLPLLPVAFLVGKAYHDKQDESDEKGHVLDFMLKHQQLARLAGEPLQFSLAGSTTYADSSRGTYEFRLEARQPLYAIVDVHRGSNPPTITLRCVTSRPMGARDAQADACAADVVSLDAPGWAVARVAKPGADEAIPEVPPIPRDAHVHIIGVYEAKNRPRTAPGSHEAGTITVNVAAAKAPLLLVLTSYEPVQWSIHNMGRPIAAVLLSGHYPSTVTGTHAKVARIGRDHLSGRRDETHKRFENRLRTFSTGPLKSQLTYYGTEFTVPAD